MSNDCSICGFPLDDCFNCLPCDFAQAAIKTGACHHNYHEQLAEKIGNVLFSRNWAEKPISLDGLFPRFS